MNGVNDKFEDYFGDNVDEEDQLIVYEANGAENVDDVATMLEADYNELYGDEALPNVDFHSLAEHMYESREWNR